jgi:hypothetical protein
MMGRSGGFNVPADYFRKIEHPGGAAMLPASPPVRKQKPVLAMVLASLAAVAFVVTGIAWWTTSKAGQKEGDGTVPMPGSATSALAIGGGTPAVPAVDAKTKLVVTVVPGDAQIGLVDGPLQTQPMSVSVGSSETVNVRVEKKGYVTQVFPISALQGDKEGFVRLKLEHEKVVVAPTPPTRPGVKTPPVKAVPSTLPAPVASVPAKPAAPPTAPGNCPTGQVRDPFGGCTKAF